MADCELSSDCKERITSITSQKVGGLSYDKSSIDPLDPTLVTRSISK